jgi:RHS repeat-associated protein
VGQNTTTYSYDPASNLATVTYPNGLESQFTYDTLNRITAMNAAKASYSYTLSPTGNRTGAVESSGRAVNWSYDGIYRLTNETISLDPHSVNGSVGYGLDPVGNRESQTSTIPGIGTGSFTYDPDDRLNTETYDANGNTLTSGGKTFTYDFENRLKSMTAGSVAVTIQYDADGNRVAKTVNGVTTRYLVDDLNPTGYAQVVEEVTAGAVTRQYTYGLQRISQTQQIANAWTPAFYGYDGGGTVRLLTDSTGTVTDTYDYDAWGNTVNATGSTPNVYLYRGEQFDSELELYYLRARWFNAPTGRLLTKDPADGVKTDPATLHKYLYASADPTNRIDPTGWQTQTGGGGAVTPEAGGYVHMPMFPIGKIQISLTFRGTLWQDPRDPRCGGSGGSGGSGGAGGSGPGGGGASRSGIKICSRAGWQNLGPGGLFNHVYLWEPDRCLVCGQGTDSYPGDENPQAPGTACVDVPGSEPIGIADRIMDCCHDKAPNLRWFPGSSDCHGLVDKCVRAVGLNPPPHPGAGSGNWNGRWGSRCPCAACQFGPWGPGHWPRP